MIKPEELEEMAAVLELELKMHRRAYSWKNAAEFEKLWGLDPFATNVPKLKEIIHLAQVALILQPHMERVLDLVSKGLYTERSSDEDPIDFPEPYRDFDSVYIQRQRAERSGCPDQGRPDESVSEALRELPVSSVYREAIARPERTWSGFARADHLRTQDEVSRAGSE